MGIPPELQLPTPEKNKDDEPFEPYDTEVHTPPRMKQPSTPPKITRERKQPRGRESYQ